MSSAKTEPEDKITINDMNMDNINPFLFIILPHLMILNTCYVLNDISFVYSYDKYFDLNFYYICFKSRV